MIELKHDELVFQFPEVHVRIPAIVNSKSTR
jgi:hypothetical protein